MKYLMAITVPFRLCVLFLCLANCIHAGIAAGECREEHCFVGDEDFPGRNARPLTSGKYAAGGRKSASMDELLKVSIFEYCRFFIDMISRKNPFTRKQVHVGRPTTSSIDHNVLFVFGDSLFDGGNGMIHNDANYSIGHYPYGYTYFSSASGRVCDGRIVPDFIGEYANLPLIPASLQHGTSFYFGANFACAGSVVLDSDNTNKTVITLNGQLAMFKQMVQEFKQTLGPDGLREMLGKAVYLFSIGGVDYINYYAAKFNGNGSFPTEAEKREFVHELVGNTTNAIIDVYEQGGRKFTFQNVGPIGCLPRVVVDYPEFNGSCVPELLFMPMLHNEELYGALTDLAERLEGFKLSFFDYFSTLYDRIMNPSDHGFKVGRTPCYNDGTLCEYPSAYVFFDSGHLTQRAYEQVAKLMWNGNASVARPHNAKQLFEDAD